MRLPLGTTDYSRSVAQIPDIALYNRFFEVDPTNQKDQVALLGRPCLRKWIGDGDLGTEGYIRAFYSQPGTFGEASFVVASDTVYKIAQDETITAIGTLTTTFGAVSMSATGVYLFIADGAKLYYYTENDYARGTLTASGAIAAGDKVVIGSFTYQWATDVTPTADGSSGAPWLVLLGGNTQESLQHLYDAIGNTGTLGTDYSETLTGSTEVAVSSVDATTLKIRALAPGTDGNSIATTETGANIAWGAATLAGGGGSNFAEIAVPDDDGIVSVGVIISFCICVVVQGVGKNGRFYWIRPGENTIDALDFATAEKAPDPVWEVKIFGDKFALPGPSSIEIWVPTGDGDAPFQRQQGILFEQGIWEGSLLILKEAMLCVGCDAMPYLVTGDGPKPVGTPGVVQRFREAINAQRAA